MKKEKAELEIELENADGLTEEEKEKRILEGDDEEIDNLTEEDIGQITNIIATDGYYIQAEIVKVSCPACGEEFMGTERHAGGFIAGHRAFHEFENEMDVIIQKLGGA